MLESIQRKLLKQYPKIPIHKLSPSPMWVKQAPWNSKFSLNWNKIKFFFQTNLLIKKRKTVNRTTPIPTYSCAGGIPWTNSCASFNNRCNWIFSSPIFSLSIVSIQKIQNSKNEIFWKIEIHINYGTIQRDGNRNDIESRLTWSDAGSGWTEYCCRIFSRKIGNTIWSLRAYFIFWVNRQPIIDLWIIKR